MAWKALLSNLFLYLIAPLDAFIEREDCILDTFEANCRSQDHVVLVNHALYGRMEQSKCLREGRDIGCHADIVRNLDSSCGGKSHCRFRVANLAASLADEGIIPCPANSQMYLSTQTRCLQGIVPGLCENLTANTSMLD